MSFDEHVLLQYYPLLLDGLATTLLAIGLSLLIGIGLGLLAALGSLSKDRFVYLLARGYVNLFRVVPEIVLLFWMFYALPPILEVRLSPLESGVLALSVVAGAFLAEIFRAGILAVPRGQIEAAHPLGIPVYHRWRRVILPQAIRRMMPAFVNYTTELLKHSALLASIGVTELTYRAYTVSSQTFKHLEFFTSIAVAYFLVIFPLSLYVRRSEARLLRRTGQ